MSYDTGMRVTPMVRLLMQECENRGITTVEMCDKYLDLSRVYFNALANGHREFKNCSPETLTKIGEFLRLSILEVELVVDAKMPADIIDPPEKLDATLLSVYRQLMVNTRYASVAKMTPEQFRKLPQHVRILIAQLYTDAQSASLRRVLAVPEDSVALAVVTAKPKRRAKPR